MNRFLILFVLFGWTCAKPTPNLIGPDSYVQYIDYVGKPNILPEKVVEQQWVHRTDFIGESYRSDKTSLQRIVRFTQWEPYKGIVIPIMGIHTYDIQTDGTIHKYYAYSLGGLTSNTICMYEMYPENPNFIKPSSRICSMFIFTKDTITYNNSQYLSTRIFSEGRKP